MPRFSEMPLVPPGRFLPRWYWLLLGGSGSWWLLFWLLWRRRHRPVTLELTFGTSTPISPED